MGEISFELNGEPTTIDVEPTMPLLWILRDTLGMTGTKYGCGVAQCGACTVHLDGVAVRSCVLEARSISGRRVRTIEGLSDAGTHPLQRAWIEESVPQCGYCQAGMLMSAAWLLSSNPAPTDSDIDNAMHGNLCRCGTYLRVRRAIQRAARSLRDGGDAVKPR